ncbi:N-acetylglucosamine-1-phosphotransferase subunit gamma-like [Polyodon spathula]|uniref:N-acetylglucosamine-1-phosphotransferase subunit gamma-like n=1 Tax=Polyodon spathula TaxID=7913 RepID=UPI001B7D98D8|nr:N-acetylglucosamine-1-phosphotransferase subunit gamma-like [Polyodon spathula]
METLQGEWDEAEQALHDELITEQVYNKTLKKIFQEASYFRDTKEKEIKEDSKSSARSQFDTLESCKEEYQKLSEEVRRLRVLLPQHCILVSMDQDNSQTATTPLQQ